MKREIGDVDLAKSRTAIAADVTLWVGKIDKARVSSVKSSRFPVAGVAGNLINPPSPWLFPVPHTGLDDCLRVLQACFRKRMPVRYM